MPEKRCCGNCKNWIPHESNMILRGKNRYRGSRCSLTNEEKSASDMKECMAWIPRRQQQEELKHGLHP